MPCSKCGNTRLDRKSNQWYCSQCEQFVAITLVPSIPMEKCPQCKTIQRARGACTNCGAGAIRAKRLGEDAPPGGITPNMVEGMWT